MDWEKLLKLDFMTPKKRPKDNPYVERFAGFNERMFASCIDIALSIIVLGPFAALTRPLIYGDIDPALQLQSFIVTYISSKQDQLLVWADLVAICRYIMDSGLWGKLMMDNVLQLVVLGAIFVYFWHRYASTPGKMLLRLVVLDEATHQKPSHASCIKRFLGYFVSIAPLCIGLLWMLVDKKGQCWHDKIAGTVVIRRAKKVRQSADPSGSPAPESGE